MRVQSEEEVYMDTKITTKATISKVKEDETASG